MTKQKGSKTIKAWAVLVSKRWSDDMGGTLQPFGNGKQYQFPIFETREEALNWWNEDRDTRGEVIFCEIKLLPHKVT